MIQRDTKILITKFIYCINIFKIYNTSILLITEKKKFPV